MSEPALKWKNNASFKENYTLELIVAFKMAYSCCSGLRSKLDFPEILQKKFYNFNYWSNISTKFMEFCFLCERYKKKRAF